MIFGRKPKPKPQQTRLGILLVEYGADKEKVDAAAEIHYQLFGSFCLSTEACNDYQLKMALSKQATQRGDYKEATEFQHEAIETLHQRRIETIDAIATQIALLVDEIKR
jgi:hypothetical protein